MAGAGTRMRNSPAPGDRAPAGAAAMITGPLPSCGLLFSLRRITRIHAPCAHRLPCAQLGLRGPIWRAAMFAPAMSLNRRRAFSHAVLGPRRPGGRLSSVAGIGRLPWGHGPWGGSGRGARGRTSSLRVGEAGRKPSCRRMRTPFAGSYLFSPRSPPSGVLESSPSTHGL